MTGHGKLVVGTNYDEQRRNMLTSPRAVSFPGLHQARPAAGPDR